MSDWFEGKPVSSRQVLGPPPVSGMPRARLIGSFSQPGLVLLVAPAGSGKTTLLSQLSYGWQGHTVWVHTTADDRPADDFVAHLAASAHTAGRELGQVLAHLRQLDRPLIVVDDLHELSGSPAVDEVLALCQFRPGAATVVLSTRHLSGLPASHLETLPGARSLGPDDLRFRLWEVDDLLRRLHGTELPPEQVHSLTRATGGWAVALHMFALTARSASPAERARLIADLTATGRVRSYLTEQVLSHLTPSDATFLSEVSVFTTLSGPACDRYLDSTATSEILRRLASIGLLQEQPDGRFAMVQLLQNHLHRDLLERLGPAALDDRRRRCAAVLSELGDRDAALSVIHDLPGASSPVQEPWILHSQAVQMLADGDPAGARDRLAEAARLLAEYGDPYPGRQLIRLIDDWLNPPSGPSITWVMALRRIVDGDEVTPAAGASADQVDEPSTWLVEAVRLLLQGQTSEAVAGFHRVAEAGDGLRPAALLGAAVAHALAGSWAASRATAELALEAAAKAGWPVLTRLAHAVHALRDPTLKLDGLVAHCTSRNDHLGAALCRLLFGLLAPELPGRAQILNEAADRLEAGPGRWLGLVSRAAADIAAGGAPQPAIARNLRQHGPLGSALLARAAAPDPVAGGRIGDGQVIELAGLVSLAPPPSGAASGPVSVSVINTFEIRRHGRAIPLDRLRPRHLELLHILACHPSVWLHRARLVDWLWPDTNEDRARASLQTAVSAVRRAIDEAGAPTIIERSGASYRLAVEAGATDLGAVDEALRQAVEADDPDRVLAALAEAYRRAEGDLVPGSGPSEWAVEARRAFRLRLAGEARRALASRPVPVGPKHLGLLASIAERCPPDDPLRDVVALIS